MGEAHLRMTREDQKRWMTCLILQGDLAYGRGQKRKAQADAATAALAEDAPAFADL